MSKKATSKKVYLAIVLVVILAVSTVAVIYATQIYKPKQKTAVSSGLKVGETFTYNIMDLSTLYSSDANPDSQQPGFNELNNTAYIITITGVNGTIVSFDTNMQLTNGTSSETSGSVNLTSGIPGGDAGFWQIFLLILLWAN